MPGSGLGTVSGSSRRRIHRIERTHDRPVGLVLLSAGRGRVGKYRTPVLDGGMETDGTLKVSVPGRSSARNSASVVRGPGSELLS
jgi:hypothetical protein